VNGDLSLNSNWTIVFWMGDCGKAKRGCEEL
jgi:hypothetical protein